MRYFLGYYNVENENVYDFFTGDNSEYHLYEDIDDITIILTDFIKNVSQDYRDYLVGRLERNGYFVHKSSKAINTFGILILDLEYKNSEVDLNTGKGLWRKINSHTSPIAKENYQILYKQIKRFIRHEKLNNLNIE